jgi:hypothetical protein
MNGNPRKQATLSDTSNLCFFVWPYYREIGGRIRTETRSRHSSDGLSLRLELDHLSMETVIGQTVAV